jgi:Zn-dependent peptidase ImmA (M78 family)
MATNKIDIAPDKLRWAYERAGINEDTAVRKYPKLQEWLAGNDKPTMKQLQDFASKFYVPFGYLFLSQMPDERIPFAMFRGAKGDNGFFDLNVFDTVCTIQRRQDWLEDYLVENEIDTCPIVNSVKIGTPIVEAVGLLRRYLELSPDWAAETGDVRSAANIITQQLENIGIFVSFNGIVGNNSHRALDVSQCRGFALVNSIAPYIFINSNDSRYAQVFTLIHEAAHIMLGVSAGHAEHIEFNDDAVEKYCDNVAAEFLVPADLLRRKWNGNYKRMSNAFKVSEVVIARRAHDLGLIEDEEYRRFWTEYNNRSFEKTKGVGGGDFYRTSVKRVGRLFAIHVRYAAESRQISFTDAYRLTGLYGETYHKFMTDNI